MADYYRKIYVSDTDEEALVAKVNEVIKKISPGNLFGVEFNPIIQKETTNKKKYDDAQLLMEREVMETTYGIKYTCIITELMEGNVSGL